MRILLTLIAGANLIALNLFIFFEIPNIEMADSKTAFALIALYVAGFVGSASGSLTYRE